MKDDMASQQHTKMLQIGKLNGEIIYMEIRPRDQSNEAITTSDESGFNAAMDKYLKGYQVMVTN